MSKATEVRDLAAAEVASGQELRNPAGIADNVSYMGKRGPLDDMGSYAVAHLGRAGRFYEIEPWADLAHELGDLMQGDLNDVDEARFMAVVDDHKSRARGLVECDPSASNLTKFAENVFRKAGAERFLGLIGSR